MTRSKNQAIVVTLKQLYRLLNNHTDLMTVRARKSNTNCDHQPSWHFTGHLQFKQQSGQERGGEGNLNIKDEKFKLRAVKFQSQTHERQNWN